MSFYLIVAWIVIPNKISGLRSNLGCAPYSQSWVFFFFKMFRIHLFCFITQLVKKLLQWSLYEVIEDILPFVLNTKQPLNDIWLLRYKHKSFGVFEKKTEFQFFRRQRLMDVSENANTYMGVIIGPPMLIRVKEL